MKKIFRTFSIAAILLIIGHVNLNAIIFLKRSAPYIAASGSWDWHISNQMRLLVSTASPVLQTGSVRPKSGGNANLSIGYCLDQWRLEAEGNYRNKKTESFLTNSGVTLTEAGLVSKWSVMGNVYYDIPLVPGYGFYLGAGVGAGFRNTKIKGITNRSRSDGAFAFQVMGGGFYDIYPCLTLTLGYRLFGITRPEDTIFIHNSTKITVQARGTPLVQSVELGLRYGF